MFSFSISRLLTIMYKEFVLMKRDPAVIVIMAILPLIIVCLAGYTINTNPKHVPTVVMSLDNSDITQELLHQINNTEYFSFVAATQNDQQAQHLLRTEKALVTLTIPLNFTKNFLRNQTPAILLEDGSVDEYSTGRATAAISGLQNHFLAQKKGGIDHLTHSTAPFQLISHRLYNPDHITQYDIVPSVIGLVLMLTMLLITVAVAFRDVQSGTIECLLVSPARPAEILLGEILSYILIGYIQLILAITLSFYLFHVPFIGKLSLLLISALPYIIAELSLGLTIATFCTTQFQAVQVVNLFIAFSVILTGFVYPIFGMPLWAQYASHFIPLTYFLKIIHGVMIKGTDFFEIWPNLWPLMLYGFIMITIAISRFQRQFT